MKKVIYILAFGLFSLMILSCTPQAITDVSDPQSCCGDDINVPPLLPPPNGSGG